MRVAVTGGAGFIGSHTTVALLDEGHDVLILDNFANAARDVPERIAELAGRHPEVSETDITDAAALGKAFGEFAPEAVIHFAGLKAVGESVEMPLEYYRVNVTGSLTLLGVCDASGCRNLVFSSSATVYGQPDHIPIDEDHPLRPTNPYGQSKLHVEQMIRDWGRANPEVSAVNLRYFNPVGAHPSGKMGELPFGPPQNLLPYTMQVAAGLRPELSVFGDDYDTPDGTGVRDYIHVLDIAEAHLAALKLAMRTTGVDSINLGTGRGYSVFEMIAAAHKASGRDIPYRVAPRRPGDVAESLADPARAAERLGWRAQLGIDDMCADAWRWQMTVSG